MKADLGKAGKNLLIPRWQGQQLTGRIYGGGEQRQWRVYQADLDSKWLPTTAEFFETKCCVF
jgi:hypothetical protein